MLKNGSFLKSILRYFIYTSLGITILASGLIAYLIWFQPPFHFPKPTGQHAVGVKTYHWVDRAKKEIFSDDPTHPNRELMVKIWYPSTDNLPQKPSTPWAPDLVEHLRKNEKLLWLLGASRPIFTYARPNSTIDSSKVFPVIIFSHGAKACNYDSNTAQCEELASHGYVVVGINHTYNSILTKFPDGRIISATKAANEITKNETFNKTKKAFDKEMETWISDAQFVLNQLESLNNNIKSIFYQRLDRKHIGMFGHSFGGATAIQMCRRDSRIKAGVDLDGGLFGSDRARTFEKPVMFLLNESIKKMGYGPSSYSTKSGFKIKTPREDQDFRSLVYFSIIQLTKSIGSKAHAFIINGTKHLDFTDIALLKQASILSSLTGLIGNLGILQGKIDGFRATKITRAYLVEFFDKYLKGKPSPLLNKKEQRYPEVSSNITTPPKNIILQSKRLYFRPFVEGDLEMLYELYSDPDVMKQIKAPIELFMGNINKKSVKEMLQHFIEDQKKHGFSKWAAFENDTGDFVGRIGLSSTENHKTAYAGYILHKRHWGKGYSTEAVQAIVKWAFENTNLEAITAATTPEHKASIRVMEKANMRFNQNFTFKGIEFVQYKIEKAKDSAMEKRLDNSSLETGTLDAIDKNQKPILFNGSPVILEWYKTKNHSTMVNLQKQALPILAEAFADEVKDCLLDENFEIKKEYLNLLGPPPETGKEEESGENPFVANAKLDREKRVEFSKHQWGEWFKTTAQSMKKAPFEYYFVTAKDGNGHLLGFSAFYISPMLTKVFPEFDVYKEGDVLLEPIAVTPKAQGLGLARPLIFSILTLAPETKRILTGTRVWITNAVNMYKKFGFVEYKREGIGVKFEYNVQHESSL
ncbi:GNAT family N-acetyltransferase [Candidatus Dependentiae bacterium]|nr:GNAT family N-acetyltransferase [Candidatus Dependentiae bacterium]